MGKEKRGVKIGARRPLSDNAVLRNSVRTMSTTILPRAITHAGEACRTVLVDTIVFTHVKPSNICDRVAHFAVAGSLFLAQLLERATFRTQSHFFYITMG